MYGAIVRCDAWRIGPVGFGIMHLPRVMSTMPEPAGLLVRDEDWPHGLRCGECARLLEDGDRYSERLTDMIGDTPLVKIVCLGCALPGKGTQP